VRVHAYLTEREATLYLDTSGDALFKRGWRREVDVAPLRENLAAGVLALAGWTPGTPLLDPMCGSGTIAIEAALAAADVAPGQGRSFGFQKLGWYDGPTWQRLRQRARDRARARAAAPSIFASDLDPQASAQCRRNAAAAGVEHGSTSAKPMSSPLRARTRRAAGRQSALRRELDDESALAAFYPKLGDALKQHFAGWTACLLSGDMRLPKLIGLKPSKRTPLFNGALECRLFRFEIVSGRPQRESRASRPPAPEC
jgi:putative N6-adenine-specific DNA methylase